MSITTPPSSTPVPPLNLAANFADCGEELLAEIAAVCKSGYYVLGPKVAAFEEALAAYCGAKHALGLTSGTDALLVALMALDIGRGDEVIVPTFTFFGTAGVVARLGARPVFGDIDPQTYNIDPGEIERRITPKTKAIMPVHLYGELADMRAIETIASKRGLPVIEDAAQAVGAREANGGRMAGAMGLCGCLSFYPTKNLGAIGDAGALTTNDTAFFETCKKLRVHGSGHTYYHDLIGGNFRIDALQAAILSIKLRRLDAWTDARRTRAARYRTLIDAAGLAPEHVRLPAEPASRHVYHQFIVRVQRRDDLTKHLAARSIGHGVYYPLPLHMQKCFANLGYKVGDFPHSERAAGEVLALPMYPELTDAQQQAVVAALAEFYGR